MYDSDAHEAMADPTVGSSAKLSATMLAASPAPSGVRIVKLKSSIACNEVILHLTYIKLRSLIKMDIYFIT